MKLKGIWITICLIVVAGVCATSYTKQYTSESVTMRSLEEAAGIPETAAAGSGDLGLASAAPRTAAVRGQVAADEAADDSALAEIAQAEAVEISPVMQELFDLDEQIERSHSKTVDTTANSLKASAESEWKLWEDRMERYLDILEKKLSDEDREALFLEQKEWIKDRETAAASASKKQNSSALVELEYNLFMKKITRERVYELAKRYEKELTEG